MDTKKGLITRFGEWLDARQARRRETAAQPRRLTTWLPSRGNMIFTLVMIALLVLAQSAGALPLPVTQHAPRNTSTGTIAYQGRLADAAGAPLTGTYNMIFRLYAVATGGTPLWSEQWTGSNGVRVSDGLFNVMLGSLSQLPVSQFTNYQSLFLGITVGTDDEMAPRVQLGSVPFAVQALTVPDGSVTSAKIADGAVTQVKLGADVSLIPPDGSITTAKIADGAVTARKLAVPSAHHRSSYYFSTNSSSFTPISGAEVTLELDVASKMLIVFAGDIQVDRQGGIAELAVTIDGQLYDPPKVEFVNAPASVRTTGSQSVIVDVGIGSHVIGLSLRSADGIATASIGHRSLSVLAFR